MKKQHKIKRNTALFICVAFILRLFVINSGLYASPTQSSVAFSKSKTFSLQNNPEVQSFIQAKALQSPLVETEYCEEADNLEELESKISPVQLELFCLACLSQTLPIGIKNSYFSDISFSKKSNSLYKDIQVFRI